MHTSIQLESLVDLRQKNGRTRYRRSIAIAALVTGTAILGMLLISGLFRYHETLGIEPPGGLGALETSLAIRPDFPVSDFLYERRSFRWFLGAAINTGLAGLAIFGTYAACVSVTAGLGVAGCTAAAIGIVGAGIGLIQAATGGGSDGVVTSDLELGSMEDFDYVRNGSKRKRAQLAKDAYMLSLMQEVFGPDYRFEGHVTAEDGEHYAHLLRMTGGKPVPVHSFTSKKGIRFHHTMLYRKERNGLFHRFGFASPRNSTSNGKRQEVEPSNEYFTSGGLDLFDCAADGEPDHLTAADADNMENLIKCNVPDFPNAKELSIQIYDQELMGTIGSGIIAPFGSDGTSVISGETGPTNCPVALSSNQTCGMDTEN